MITVYTNKCRYTMYVYIVYVGRVGAITRSVYTHAAVPRL